MARTATRKKSSRDGAVPAATDAAPTATTTSASQQDRRSSPYADRRSSPYAERRQHHSENVSPQLNTPTKKRPSAARQSQAKNGGGGGHVSSIYDVPDDDIDAFENSRLHEEEERHLPVPSNPVNRKRSSAVSKAALPVNRKAKSSAVADEDEENDEDEEEGQGEVEDVAAAEDETPVEEPPAATPRKRGRPPKARIADADEQPTDAVESTPTSKRRRIDAFSTPVKATPARLTQGRGGGRGGRGGASVDTPTTRRTLADRSARKKSTRALIDRMVTGGDDDEDEEALGDAILDEEEEEEEDGEDDIKENEEEEEPEPEPEAGVPAPEEVAVAPTPRKRGRPPKAKPADQGAAAAAAAGTNGDAPVKRGPGRPRKNATAATAAARDPTPPRDLPAHEHYFFQNRAGAGVKTSNNTLASLRLLTHDEYFRLREGGVEGGRNRHEKEIGYLEALHAQSFAQWAFELAQGFSVCLYGYGSKQRVLRAFATALHRGIRDHDAHKIVMVNGGTGTGAAAGSGAAAPTASASASTLRDILLVVGAAANKATPKLPSGAAAAERALFALLDSSTSTTLVTLVVNGIDSPGLRRPAAQATLARLAAHRRVRLLCAADTPGFALLWDGAARSLQNFVFHDATTFRPMAGLDTVDEVHALLGRRVRRVGGKDGAAFVLRSLPENARSLFQLLVGEVLAADEGGGSGGGTRRGGVGDGYDNDDYENDDDDADGRGDGDDAAESVGLEYRMLYNKAVEEFICSSEMAFRTLLKEFHDHQMVTSRKDAFGTEMLSLPFRRDELEALLEDLAS